MAQKGQIILCPGMCFLVLPAKKILRTKRHMGQPVKILRCGHYDVKGDTIGEYVKDMPGGIAVKVTGQFRDALSRFSTEKTEIVFVSNGDYEFVADPS